MLNLICLLKKKCEYIEKNVSRVYVQCKEYEDIKRLDTCCKKMLKVSENDIYCNKRHGNNEQFYVYVIKETWKYRKTIFFIEKYVSIGES